MVEAFRGSDADGRWSMRDAYDALEAAQASDTLVPDDDPNPDWGPEDEFADILAFEKALPTQTYRSEHQVDMQQFSTPAALSWLAARAAAITAEDHVLEPSAGTRSEEHTSELQSLMRISYAVFCLKKKTTSNQTHSTKMTKNDRTD